LSQVKTISEQLPAALGPDVIKPRSAAIAGGGLMLTASPKKNAVAKNFEKLARIGTPKG
jgi:hypothetical protein